MKEEVSKEIHDALTKLGFKKDGRYYRKDGDSIKVYPHTELSEIFRQLIQFGDTQRSWKIKNALNL